MEIVKFSCNAPFLDLSNGLAKFILFVEFLGFRLDRLGPLGSPWDHLGDRVGTPLGPACADRGMVLQKPFAASVEAPPGVL